jgi:hypothetical protein
MTEKPNSASRHSALSYVAKCAQGLLIAIAFKASRHWSKLPRKVKWMTACTAVYAAFCAVLLTMDLVTLITSKTAPLHHWHDYSAYLQFTWLIVLGSPFAYKPLGNWVFKRAQAPNK